MSGIELPQHYYPVPVCPHVGLGPNQRLMFADYGSYQNINVKINEGDSRENISFLPQKGQGSLQNIHSLLPSLPLFDRPLQGEWLEWDEILGMKSFDGILKDLRCIVQTAPRFKGLIGNKPNSKLAQNFNMLKEKVMNSEVLFSDLDKGLQNLVSSYTDITNVYNSNCLNGFNRDFYGGLLNTSRVLGTDCHSVIHATGKGFKDIVWTNVYQDPETQLKNPEIISKLSLSAQVYGLSSTKKMAEKVLVSARKKHSCLLLVADVFKRTLQQQGAFDSSGDNLSHTCFSPYMENELLLSTENGIIYLWDINSRCSALVEKTARFECKDKWSSAYFGGHPRQIVVADNTSVEIFDHRSHYSDGQELFSLSSSLIKTNERVMAAASLGFPYHVVATDYALFVMDQRFGSSPVLQWNTELKACPQYLQVIDQSNRENNTGKLIFLASQQPAEVMCFQLDVTSGHSPNSSLLPWKVSPIGEFSGSVHTNHTADPSSSDRFQASLAGLAVTQQSRSDGFTVYQMDSYGDIFYQTIERFKTISNIERNASKLRSSNWMQQLDDIGKKRSVGGLESTSKQVFIDPEIMKDVFAYPMNIQDVTAVKTSRKVPKTAFHRNLKPAEKLPCKGYNTQLHLALRDNKDIKEILKLREAQDRMVKKKLREKTLQELRKTPRSVPRNNTRKGRLKSSSRKLPFNCQQTDSDDSSDIDCQTEKTQSDTDDGDSFTFRPCGADPDHLDINLEDFMDQLNVSLVDSESLDIDNMDVDLLHGDLDNLDHSFNLHENLDLSFNSADDNSTKTLLSDRQLSSFTRSDASTGKSGKSLPYAVNQNRVRRLFQQHPDVQSSMATSESKNSESPDVNLGSLSPGELSPSGHPVFTQPTTVVSVKKKRNKVLSPLSDASLPDMSVSSIEMTEVKTLDKTTKGVTPRRRSTKQSVSKNKFRTAKTVVSNRAKRKKESTEETLPSEKMMSKLSFLNIDEGDESCKCGQTGKTCPVDSQQMVAWTQSSDFCSLGESHLRSSVYVSPGGFPSQTSQTKDSLPSLPTIFQKSKVSPQTLSSFGQEKIPPAVDVATPLNKASPARSQSLFSNLSGTWPTPSELGVGAAGTPSKLSWFHAGSQDDIPSSQTQPKYNILLWLSTNDLTSTSPSTNRLSPSECLTSPAKLSPSHCPLQGITSPLGDEGEDKNPVRRKLTYNAFTERQMPVNNPSVGGVNQPGSVECVLTQSTSLQLSDDSDCSDSLDSLCSSLPTSITNITLATPKLRRYIDPSLSGFLSSPKMQGAKNIKHAPTTHR